LSTITDGYVKWFYSYVKFRIPEEAFCDVLSELYFVFVALLFLSYNYPTKVPTELVDAGVVLYSKSN
jgi:hypothetical protein